MFFHQSVCLSVHASKPVCHFNRSLILLHTRVYPKVSGLGHNEINNNNNKHSLGAIQRVMAAKLTRLTHKIAIKLHLVAENCTI